MLPVWNSSCATDGVIDGDKFTANSGSWGAVGSTNSIAEGVAGEITWTAGNSITAGDKHTILGFSNSGACSAWSSSFAKRMMRADYSGTYYKYYVEGSLVNTSSVTTDSDHVLKIHKDADGIITCYIDGVLDYTFSGDYDRQVFALANCAVDGSFVLPQGSSPPPPSGGDGGLFPPPPINLVRF